MIRYLHYKDIDRQKWDACLEHSVNSLMYGYSWYLDQLCLRWDALILDDYEAVFPLPVNNRFGLKYSLQPILTQQLGLFSKTPVTAGLLQDFLSHIPKHFLWVKLNLNSQNTFEGSGLPLKTNLVLALHADYETISATYNSGTKRNVKKFAKSGNSLTEQADAGQMLTLLWEQIQRKQIALNEKNFGKLSGLIRYGLDQDMVEIYGSLSSGNELNAACAIFRHRNRLYYLVPASSPKGLEDSAMFGIIDHIIKKYAGQQMLLDFEGSEMEGIARFFRGFGAENAPYPVFERKVWKR